MSTQPTDLLTVISYNSTGFNAQRSDFICDIVEQRKRENCIVAIQEHFIFDKNLAKIQKLFPSDFVVYSKGSFKDNSRIKMGRGKGGLSLIWHKSLDHLTTRIQVKLNNRIQCLCLELPGCRLLLINAYSPQDSQTDNFDEQDLISCLTTIENLIASTAHDQVVVLGDLNCDFRRNTRFVQLVREFCQTQQLLSAWTWFPVDFTYSSPCDTSFSLVDHFLLSDILGSQVVYAGVIHRGDNVSGHAPIFSEFEVDHLPRKLLPEIKKVPKQNWKCATPSDKLNYKNRLQERLSRIHIPQDCLNCEDVKCMDADHCVDLDNYIIDIIEAVEDTTKDTIPYKNAPKDTKFKASRRKCLPGWREHVLPFKLEARFWYQEWRSAGKPMWGLLYDNMRFYRNKFKYAKRRTLIAAEAIRRDRFLESSLEGDKSLFEELKKFKGAPPNIASKVDGHTDPESITNHLKNIYQGLYNRTGTKAPLQNLLDEVNESITSSDTTEVEKVTPELIQKIVKDKIKSEKSDPEFDLTTDNLKQAPFSLFVHLANFFKGILIHGSISPSLLICAILLLIKDKNGATDNSNNYRGIALSSIILKVFDWVVLILFDKELKNDENQFGYQAESSANMCTWTAIKTINYFVNRGSPVYVCLLDYRKAFDYCNHVIMFRNLQAVHQAHHGYVPQPNLLHKMAADLFRFLCGY